MSTKTEFSAQASFPIYGTRIPRNHSRVICLIFLEENFKVRRYIKQQYLFHNKENDRYFTHNLIYKNDLLLLTLK